MSPEARAAIADLSRLRKEIAQDRAAMGRHLADARPLLAVGPLPEEDRASLALGAVAVHSWYTGLETVLERIARLIDASVPSGEHGHRDLLSQCLVEVPGTRPPVLPAGVEADLNASLSFRHFFRRAYAVDFDPERVHAVLERLARIAPSIDEALDRFDRFLAATIEAASGSS